MRYPHSLSTVDVSRFASVVQSQKSPNVSEKYTFIPTTKPLEVFADYGWYPTRVIEAGTRSESVEGYQKHAVILSNDQYTRELGALGETLPQIMLTNAHCGTTAFHLDVALLELVCLNGLVVSNGSYGQVRVHHRGYTDSYVEEGIKQILERLPRALMFAELARRVFLSDSERITFARRAVEMRFDGSKYEVDPVRILQATRRTQATCSLWHTYNVVQEALIRGGFYQKNLEKKRYQRARAVSSIDQNKRINQGLWSLAIGYGVQHGINI